MSLRFDRLLMIAALILPSASALADFKDVLDSPAIQTPLAKSAPLQAVARAGNHLVAVGARGDILISTDNGDSWTQVPVPVSSDLTAVAFPDPLHGWAVGHDGIVLATVDGGQTWEKQLDGTQLGRLMVEQSEPVWRDEARQYQAEGADKPFLDVWFADAKTGYVVGAFNLIFKTSDGGKNWHSLFGRTANPQRLHLYSIQPSANALYIAGEGGLLLRSSAASDDFKAMALPYSGSLFGVRSDGKSLLVFGLRGNLFRSDDEGAHWSKIETGERSGLVGSGVAPGGRMTIVAQSGGALTSEDGFKSFQIRRPRTALQASGVADLGGDRLILTGLQGAATISLIEAPQ